MPKTRPWRHVLTSTLVALSAGTAACAQEALLNDGQLDLDRRFTAAQLQGCEFDAPLPASSSQAVATARKLVPTPTGVYAGLYTIPVTLDGYYGYATDTGAFPPIVYSFHDLFSDSNDTDEPDREFDDAMEGPTDLTPLQMARILHEEGSILALAWAVYCCDINIPEFFAGEVPPHDHVNRILAGQHDDLIRRNARLIRDNGVPIMLTIMAEFNWQGFFLFGDDGRTWMTEADNLCGHYGDPRWPDGPERVRDMMRHIIDLFRDEGVNNVTWMMYSANNYMSPAEEDQSIWLHPRFYYAGDDYIDWIGQSVYYAGEDWSGVIESVRTYYEVFLAGYEAWTSVTDKPMLLPEFGLSAPANIDRTETFTRTFTEFLPATPQVRAVTIGDADLFAGFFDLPRFSQRPEEVAVFQRHVLGDPFYHVHPRIEPVFRMRRMPDHYWPEQEQ